MYFHIYPLWCLICWIPVSVLQMGFCGADPDSEQYEEDDERDERGEEPDSWQDYLAKYTPAPSYFTVYRPPGAPGWQSWYHSLPVELHHID